MAALNERGLILAALAVAAVVVWRIAANPAASGRAVGGALVSAADGAIAGTVEGMGGLVGVPVTDSDQCAQDRAAGRTWEASFSCPASDFLKYVFN